jgi:hypothetical protein
MAKSDEVSESEESGNQGCQAVLGCVIFLVVGACCAGALGDLFQDNSNEPREVQPDKTPEELAKQCCLDCGAPWGDGCEFRTKDQARCLMECIDEGSP